VRDVLARADGTFAIASSQPTWGVIVEERNGVRRVDLRGARLIELAERGDVLWVASDAGLTRVARDGSVDAPIGRHQTQRTRMAVTERGRAARTRYRVLERYARATLLECSLDTGRTHQIRVHLQSIGHPLVGDPVYRAGRGTAPGPLASFTRQALHAYRLGLVHPVSGAAMQWEAQMPEDMRALLEDIAA